MDGLKVDDSVATRHVARTMVQATVDYYTYAKSCGCAFCSDYDAKKQIYVAVAGHKPGCPLKVFRSALDSGDFTAVPAALVVFYQGRENFNR